MKKLSTFIACLVSVPVMASTPIELKAPVDHIYVPTGFDSNDTAEVIVTGYLPNLCHKSPATDVEIKGNHINIEVTTLYYDGTSPFCPSMIVPFTKSIKLGLLDKGDYKITVNERSPYELESKIKVARSTSQAVDDFQYAYVNYIDKEVGNGEVALKGYNPSDCFELEKIDHVDNGDDTYSILPKMKQVRSFCPMKMVPFSYKWKVPSKLNKSKVLLHVRTMDGNSVNTIYSK